MVRAKTHSERSYEAAQAQQKQAEKDAQTAQRAISSLTYKLEAKRRSLRDLENAERHGTAEQNDRANRGSKIADLRRDIEHLERELSQAEQAAASAGLEADSARTQASEAGAAFTVERDQKILDEAANKQDMQREKLELDKQKFALAEKTKLDDAKQKLALAEQQGANAMEIERYRAKVEAAKMQFEWQQKRELAEWEAQQRTHETALANQGALALARIQGDIAKDASLRDHEQALEVIDASALADIQRAVADGEIHRENVTHEVNESIRKAFEMLAINAQQSSTEMLNAAQLMVLKHHLAKDFETHKHNLAREGRTDDLAELAADYQRAAQWIEDQGKPN